MATKLKASERQKFLVNYLKDKSVPEGYYVKQTKNGVIQFRRIKQNDTLLKIQKLEEKLKLLKEQYAKEQADSQSVEEEDDQ